MRGERVVKKGKEKGRGISPPRSLLKVGAYGGDGMGRDGRTRGREYGGNSAMVVGG